MGLMASTMISKLCGYTLESIPFQTKLVVISWYKNCTESHRKVVRRFISLSYVREGMGIYLRGWVRGWALKQKYFANKKENIRPDLLF